MLFDDVIKPKRIFIVTAFLLSLTLMFLLFPKTIRLGSGREQEPAPADNHLFADFVARKKDLPVEDDGISLAAVGDIMLSRVVADKINRHGRDYPFSGARVWLSEADLVFGNLETPLIAGRRILTGEMVFRADSDLAFTLKDNNFSILSLANNHTMNFGHEGIRQTFSSFDRAGLSYVGAGENITEARQAKYLTGQGIKLAFLAYNDDDVVPDFYAAGEDRPGTAFMNLEAMKEAIRQAKTEADFVIVSLHSGREYEAIHSRRQEDFSRAAIDAGAELVIGHHPHVVQDAEIYKGKLIFYSLGNFIFDQMWSPETRQSLGVKLFFSSTGLYRVGLYPFRIDDYAQPNIIKGAAVTEILQRTKLGYQEKYVYFWNEEDQVFSKESVAFVDLAKPGFGNLFKVSSLINEDGRDVVYELKAGRLMIKHKNGGTIWLSPENWWIEDFALADFSGDGSSDIGLSVWRVDNQEIKNFLAIYDLSADQEKPIFESSDFSGPICRLAARDFNGDDRPEIVALEGLYDDSFICNSRRVFVSLWDGAELKNIWSEPVQGYHRIIIEGLDDRPGFILD